MSTVLSNWKLLCSDNGTDWQIVHIATDQTNWTNVPKVFDLSGNSQLPISGIIRGRVAIFGLIDRILDINSQIKVLTKTIGYIPGTTQSLIPSFVGGIPQLTSGYFYKYLLNLTGAFPGKVSIGGRINITLDAQSVDATPTHCFKGRVALSGEVIGKNLTVLSTILAVIPIDIKAWLNITDLTLTGKLTGGISNSGGLDLNLFSLQSRFIGSNSRFIIRWSTSSIQTQFFLRVKIYGTMEAELPSYLTPTFQGLVPQPVYITARMQTNSISLFFRFIVQITVTIHLITSWPTSLSTFAVSYVGMARLSMKNILSGIFAKSGPPVISHVAWQLNWPTSRIYGVGHIVYSVSPTLNTLKSNIFIRVPSHIYGDWVCTLENDISSILIKNWKWFKTEFADWKLIPVQSLTKGIIWIAGSLTNKNTDLSGISIFSQIQMVVPLAIKGVIDFKIGPVYSYGTIIARTLIFGKLITSTSKFAEVKFIGTITAGKIKAYLSDLTGTFRLRTIVHTLITLACYSTGPYISVFKITPDIYGRIANRGRIDIKLEHKPIIHPIDDSSLISWITGHVPIQPKPCFGLINSSLASLISTILLKMRLIYGTQSELLESVVPYFRGHVLLQGQLSYLFRSIKFFSLFKLDHFAGMLIGTVNSPKGNILAHSRTLSILRLTTGSLSSRILVDTDPIIHGRMVLDIMAYQSSQILAYNGGLFANFAAIYKRLVYGKIEGKNLNILFTTIFGQVPYFIYGIFNSHTGQDKVKGTGRVSGMGSWHSDLRYNGVTAQRFYGSATCGQLQSSLSNKGEFLGIAAHSILAMMRMTIISERVIGPKGYDYPLVIQFRGRASIVGNIRTVTQGVATGFVRTANSSIGSILGGDTRPVYTACYPRGDAPCKPELEQRIGHLIDIDDQKYWTLGWITGDFNAFHQFPIIGRIYTPNLDRYATPMSTQFKLYMEILGTLELEINPYVEWKTVMLIYAQFKGIKIKGEIKPTLKELFPWIIGTLRGSTVGTLAADLKPMEGHGGGFAPLKGNCIPHLQNLTGVVGIKVPIHYKAILNPALEDSYSHLTALIRIQVFGRLINTYLSDFQINSDIRCWFKIIGRMLAKIDNGFKSSDIYGRIINVVGILVPTGKLDRIVIKMVGYVPLNGDNISFTKAWFLAKLPNYLTSQIKIKVNIYANCNLHLTNNTSVVWAKTPIRLFITMNNLLSSVQWVSTGLQWPLARSINVLDGISSQFSLRYSRPITVLMDLVLNPVFSVVVTFIKVEGNWQSVLNSIDLPWWIIYGRYGTQLFTLNLLRSSIHGLFYPKAIQIPKGRVYTVRGTLDDSSNEPHTYKMSVYDISTGERLQQLPQLLKSPTSYQFNSLYRGTLGVLCHPTQIMSHDQFKIVHLPSF